MKGPSSTFYAATIGGGMLTLGLAVASAVSQDFVFVIFGGVFWVGVVIGGIAEDLN